MAFNRIIEFGFDAPSASWVKSNIVSMEQKPFDGLAFIPGSTYMNMWCPDNWTSDNRYLDVPSISTIQWTKFKGNCFLLIFCNNLESYNLDYWDNTAWTAIIKNMEVLAKVAYDTNCAGILFDQEFYASQGSSPWAYTTVSRGHTLVETQAQIRKRGAQVMSAWQSQYPTITILYTDLTTAATDYDLLPHWVNGQLDAVTTATIVEGDEHAYYLQFTEDFFTRYNNFKTIPSTLDSANSTKWINNVQVGKSLYWEIVAKDTAIQDRWEHNTFMSLATTDKWVWVYSNGINWWGVDKANQPIGGLDPTAIPSGAIEGITNGKTKYFAHKQLGWDWKAGKDTNVSVTINNITPPTVVATGGTISKVVFYLNSIPIATKTSAPYTLDVSTYPPGTYTLMARAYNSAKSSGTSQMVEIIIGTTPPVIIEPPVIIDPPIVLPVPTLSVTSITPNTAYNGASITTTISGNGFKQGTYAKLTSSTSPNITASVSTFVSDTTLTSTFPITGKSAGSYNLMIINPDNSSATLPSALTIKQQVAPTITKIKPTTISNKANATLLITGTGFTTVTTGKITKLLTSKAISIIKQTSTSITCTIPSKGISTGIYTLTLTNPDGKTAKFKITITK